MAGLSSTSLGRSREPSRDRPRPMDQAEAWQGIKGREPCITFEYDSTTKETNELSDNF